MNETEWEKVRKLMQHWDLCGLAALPSAWLHLQ
jgi:hypothetical protein